VAVFCCAVVSAVLGFLKRLLQVDTQILTFCFKKKEKKKRWTAA
jgi:hypothetical protein